jgi:hypothetical protein
MLEMDGGGAAVQRVLVSVVMRAENPVVVDDTDSFEGRDASGSSSVLYDTVGVFPASWVNFVLNEPGIYAVSVSSRASDDEEWQNRGDMTLSLINGESGKNRNAPMQIYEAGHRYWRLVPKNGLPALPEMRVSWRPKELVFVAQGRVPYILAIGSTKESPGLARPDLMRSALDSVEDGDMLEAKANEALDEPAGSAAATDESGPENKKWSQYAVWAILTAGALLLSWIALSLIQKGREE